MIGEVVNTIKGLLSSIEPEYFFECDEARMINVKVDTVPRDKNFIYLEEPTYGNYNLPYRGFEKQQTFLYLYFCKFEEMHNDAYRGDTPWSEASPTVKRITLRDEIEETMVRPFLYQLRHSELGMRYPSMMETIRVAYPRARFDANEVSVRLEIMLEEDWCLNNYKPRP